MALTRWLTALALSGILMTGPAAALALCSQPHHAKSRHHDGRADYRRFRAAAEHGNAAAQNQLGVLFNRGRGVPQDYIEAVRWWHLSADRGNAIAQCNLGIMYSYGQGVKQDEVLAHMWFNLAAARGSREARKRRDNIATWRMSHKQVLDAQLLAAEFEAEH